MVCSQESAVSSPGDVIPHMTYGIPVTEHCRSSWEILWWSKCASGHFQSPHIENNNNNNWKGSTVTINIHQRPLDPLQQWRCLTTASIHKSSPCPARGNSPRQTGAKVCTECFLRLSFGFCHTHSNSANSRVRCWCEWSTSGRDPAPGVRFPSVWRRLALVWKDYTRFPSVKQHKWLRAVLWLWTVQRSLRTERGLFFSVKTGGGFWPSFKKALCFSLTKKMLAHEHSQPRKRFKWPKEEVQYHSASFFCSSDCLNADPPACKVIVVYTDDSTSVQMWFSKARAVTLEASQV